MPGSPFHTSRFRYIIFYVAVLALQIGWLLLEKSSEGRAELIDSIENTFRQTREVMTKNNVELMLVIQDFAHDYRMPYSKYQADRMKRAQALVAAFEKNIETEQIGSLHASFVLIADSDLPVYQMGAARLIDSTCLEKYNDLKTSQMLVQSQGLFTLLLNYCNASIGRNEGGGSWYQPDFLPSIWIPITGDTFQAEIVLSAYYNPRCVDYSCWVNNQPLPCSDGAAQLRTTFSTPGQHILHIRFRRENCRDGSVTDMSRDFRINVIAKCGSGD